MNEWNERVERKIDHLVARISSIDITLAAHHESLKDHIRRTELLEEEIVPLRKQHYMTVGIAKLVGVLALIATIIRVIYEIVNK